MMVGKLNQSLGLESLLFTAKFVLPFHITL